MHTRMEEQGVAVINQSQHLPSDQNSNQFESGCDGWSTCVKFGEREREGLFNGHCVVDVDCCPRDIHKLNGKCIDNICYDSADME